MKCIVIDDEPLAQQLVQQYLADVPDLELAGVFKNGLEAMPALQQEAVDLIFLDINMPKLSGLDLLRSLRHPPIVVITTAYRDFAVEAYELDVVDYLEKPFSFHRFLRAVNKAQEKMAVAKAKQTRNESPQPKPAAADEPAFIFVKSNKKSLKVMLDEVLYLESMSDYVRMHLTDRKITLHSTLKNVEQWLPAHQFPRIHKSYIVALAKVEQVEGNQVHIGEQTLPIGTNYRKGFLELIQSFSGR